MKKAPNVGGKDGDAMKRDVPISAICYALFVCAYLACVWAFSEWIQENNAELVMHLLFGVVGFIVLGATKAREDIVSIHLVSSIGAIGGHLIGELLLIFI